MIIDIIAYFSQRENVICARCDCCFSVFALTEDEILVFTNQKTDDTIRGFICPKCGSKLLLPTTEEEEIEDEEYE